MGMSEMYASSIANMTATITSYDMEMAMYAGETSKLSIAAAADKTTKDTLTADRAVVNSWYTDETTAYNAGVAASNAVLSAIDSAVTSLKETKFLQTEQLHNIAADPRAEHLRSFLQTTASAGPAEAATIHSASIIFHLTSLKTTIMEDMESEQNAYVTMTKEKEAIVDQLGLDITAFEQAYLAKKKMAAATSASYEIAKSAKGVVDASKVQEVAAQGNFASSCKASIAGEKKTI